MFYAVHNRKPPRVLVHRAWVSELDFHRAIKRFFAEHWLKRSPQHENFGYSRHRRGIRLLRRSGTYGIVRRVSTRRPTCTRSKDNFVQC